MLAIRKRSVFFYWIVELLFVVDEYFLFLTACIMVYPCSNEPDVELVLLICIGFRRVGDIDMWLAFCLIDLL